MEVETIAMARLRGVFAALIVVLIWPGAAAGSQMDPTGPPTSTGPIVASNEAYEGDHCSERTFEGAVTATTCRFFFRYKPAEEMDPSNDYGMWWFQSRYQPAEGWCLVKVKTSIAVDGATVSASSEKRRAVTSGKTEIGIRLVGNATGSASEASLANRLTVRTGSFVSHFRTDNSIMKLRWEGPGTKKAVALAGGYEASWPSPETPPPFTVSAGPSFMPC